MQSIYYLIMHYKMYAILLVVSDFVLAVELVNLASCYGGSRTVEAMGNRRQSKSMYLRCILLVRHSIQQYGGVEKKAGIYQKAVNRMRKSGYTGEAAPVVYFLLKYAVSAVLAIAAFIINFPNILPVFGAVAGYLIIMEAILASNHRKINLKLQKYMYKIYKYLNNQISSGVRVADAIRTVYEVIDDKKLRSILIRLAALYELTLDIDKALEEFRRNFDVHEVETLCVVLKQGIETGDNRELLARQEEVMFKKYFNYIQAETDSCKTRCLMSAVMYTAAIVLMIIIPLLNDTADAVGKIFIN